MSQKYAKIKISDLAYSTFTSQRYNKMKLPDLIYSIFT